MGEYYDPTKHDISKYPEKPAYFKNLEKARQVRHQILQEKKARETEHFLETVGTARDMLNEPKLWFDHCEKVGKRKKPGRPPLPPEQRKKKPVKRSGEMKALLLDHGYELDDDGYIPGFDKVRMMVNGRLHFEEENLKISVHQFIKEYL